jgi:hypothetical protein
MIARNLGTDQDILAYFTRPARSIYHARISDIRNGRKHASVKAASDEELDRFLKTWPQIDWRTGLHLYGDELLIKAREAMLLAVQSYNNPKTHFRSEGSGAIGPFWPLRTSKVILGAEIGTFPTVTISLWRHSRSTKTASKSACLLHLRLNPPQG